MNVTVPTLRGIIVRDEDDRIIVRATAEEVQRFAHTRIGSPVDMRPATLRVTVPHTGATSPTSWDSYYNQTPPGIIRMRGSRPPVLYDVNGQPVAIVREARTEMMGTGWVPGQFKNGEYFVHIVADGVPGVRVE